MAAVPDPSAPLLALDAASPLVSVAVGRGGAVLAERAEPIERSARRLLPMIDEALREAGVALAGLGGIVALRGPGSFTGLRVGLATALGLQMALEIPATAVPTLAVLASLVPPGERAVAVVDSLRGEWMVEGGALVPGPELARLAPCTIVGFGVARLAEAAELPGWPAGARLLEPGPLAPAALRWLAAGAAVDWDPGLLTAPIYARPPAVTMPKPRMAPRTALAGSPP